MTKSQLFKAAHALARKSLRPGDAYSVTFGAALRILYAEAKAPKTIRVTAEIPARRLGRSIIPARVDVFEQDADGRWTYTSEGGIALFEKEVVDICRRAKNWSQIKAAHFPMVGFHS